LDTQVFKKLVKALIQRANDAPKQPFCPLPLLVTKALGKVVQRALIHPGHDLTAIQTILKYHLGHSKISYGLFTEPMWPNSINTIDDDDKQLFIDLISVLPWVYILNIHATWATEADDFSSLWSVIIQRVRRGDFPTGPMEETFKKKWLLNSYFTFDDNVEKFFKRASPDLVEFMMDTLLRCGWNTDRKLKQAFEGIVASDHQRVEKLSAWMDAQMKLIKKELYRSNLSNTQWITEIDKKVGPLIDKAILDLNNKADKWRFIRNAYQKHGEVVPRRYTLNRYDQKGIITEYVLKIRKRQELDVKAHAFIEKKTEPSLPSEINSHSKARRGSFSAVRLLQNKDVNFICPTRFLGSRRPNSFHGISAIRKGKN